MSRQDIDAVMARLERRISHDKENSRLRQV